MGPAQQLRSVFPLGIGSWLRAPRRLACRHRYQVNEDAFPRSLMLYDGSFLTRFGLLACAASRESLRTFSQGFKHDVAFWEELPLLGKLDSTVLTPVCAFVVSEDRRLRQHAIEPFVQLASFHLYRCLAWILNVSPRFHSGSC